MIAEHTTVDSFAESLRSRGKLPSTVESYCRDAQRFLSYLSDQNMVPRDVAPDTLVAFQDYLRHDCEERDNSVRRMVIGVRQFFRFLSESRTIGSTPFDDVPIPNRDERLPKTLSADDLDALLAVALAGRPEFKAARDASMVTLLAYEGIKANELINLRWEDLLDEGSKGTLRIPGTKARAIPLSADSYDTLKTYQRLYVDFRHPSLEGVKDRRMFLAFKGRDAASPLPEMTRHGLKFILYEIGGKTGLEHLNTEQLRHFAVCHLLSLGKSPEGVMQHLGLRRLGNIAKHLSRGAAPQRVLVGASARP